MKITGAIPGGLKRDLGVLRFVGRLEAWALN